MKHVLLFAALLTAPLTAHPDPRHTLDEIEEHLLETPNDPELLIRKADLFLQTKKHDEAAEIIAKLLEAQPKNPEVRLLDIRLLLDQEQGEEAASKASVLTEAHPRHAEAWRVRARAEEARGQREEAIMALSKHMDLAAKPNPGDALMGAGWMEEKGDAAGAVKILDQCLSKVGCLSGLQQRAIGLEIGLERYDSALRRIDALEARFRPSVELSLKRAEILEKAKRFGEAANACDSALALLDAQPAAKKRGVVYQHHFQILSTRKAENQKKAGVR
jgi:predicted Zn-dependent protease